MNLFGLERVGPGHLGRLPAKCAAAVEFPCLRGNPDVGGTLVALDDLQGKFRGGGEDLGIVGAGGAGAIATQFDSGFGLAPILCAPDAAAFGRHAHHRIRRRHAQPAKFAPLEEHRRVAHHVLHNQRAGPIADHRAVAGSAIEDVVRRDQHARPRHILHNNGRVCRECIDRCGGRSAWCRYRNRRRRSRRR